MAGAGIVAGVVAHAAFDLAGSPWALVAVAAGAAAGAALAVKERAWRLGVMALLLGAAGAALMLAPAAERSLGIAAFAVLSGAALARGMRGWRLAAAVATGAGAVLLARHVFLSVATAQELAGLPGWVVAAIAGAGFGFVAVFALLPRHVEIVTDEVAAAYESVSGEMRGEVAELVRRGYDLWKRAAERIEEGDPNRDTLREATMRLLEVAKRWQRVEAERPNHLSMSLVDRMNELEERIERTEDPVAREQYELARKALGEQLRYLKDIGKHRERVVARMHNYLAAMEQLRLAVVKLASTDAARGEITPLLSEIAELGRDMDTSSEALLEAVESATH